MWRFAWAEVRHRRERTAILFVAILLATTGFTVLTAATETSRLVTVGTVNARARTLYDILVRPAGSRSRLELDRALIAADAIAGRAFASASAIGRSGPAAPGEWCGADRVGHEPAVTAGSTVLTAPSSVSCVWSPAEVALSGTQRVMAEVPFPFPMMLVAVDPVAEDRLDGFDAASTGAGAGQLALHSTAVRSRQFVQVPVLMAREAPVGGSVTVTVSRLPADADRITLAGGSTQDLSALSGDVVHQETFTAAQVYRQMRAEMSTFTARYGAAGLVRQYWTASTPEFGTDPDGSFRAVEQENLLSALWVDRSDFALAPASADDTQFRRLVVHRQQPADRGAVAAYPVLTAVGGFDPRALQGLADETASILSGWNTAPTVGSDDATRRLLGDAPVPPSTNLGALVAAPPLIVTSLEAMQPLVGGDWQPQGDGAGPISVIRVRVADVSGVDELSRAKVRRVAESIQELTGLDVDVTVGSSAAEQALVQPPSADGRAELRLSQWWVKKGVATAILDAVDTKSVALFLLVLAVAALSVANTVSASARARRADLGVLAGLGWTRAALLGALCLETTIVACFAGLLAGALALAAGRIIGMPVSPARAAVALPVAVGVALLAAAGPAWSAAKAHPMQAILGAVTSPRRVRSIASPFDLARANLARNRARSCFAALGLALAAAAATTLIAVTGAFHNVVVGTLLGNVVDLQARPADVAAVSATCLLAAAGLWLSTLLTIRDRATEFATLRAIGWAEAALRRLLLLEAAVVGLTGALSGALIACLMIRVIVGHLPVAVLIGALGVVGALVLSSLVATAAALPALARVSAHALFTE